MTGRLEDYEVLNIIGTGSFSTCYKVLKKSNDHLYVWKAIAYSGMSEEKKQLLVSEVNLLSELRHPNIVQYYDRIVHKDTATLYIIMEWCKGGDLATLINKCKKSCSFIDEGFAWRVLYQLCRALQACHWHLSKVTVLHRDIKPANVFLDGFGNVKLGDFGLARILHNDASYAQTLVGTPYYMSPEVIKGGKYNKKSDIWSLGCLMYELCSLSPPFTGQNIKHLALKIKEGKFARIPAHYSDDMQKIISLLLSVEHNLRPSIEIILHHPIVVSHITQETLKTITVKSEGELHSNSKEDILDPKEEFTSVAHKLDDLHLPLDIKAPLQDKNKIGKWKEISDENIRDIWLNRLHILRQRETTLREKELTIDERERAVTKKEKHVALLDRLMREKMMRADIYLRQCREARSVTSSVRNSQKRYSLAEPDLDTTVSADPGDTSILPTSTKLKPECVTKPPPFVKSDCVKHVHFGTLPGTRCKEKHFSHLERTSKQTVPQSGLFSEVLHDIQEHVSSDDTKMNTDTRRNEDRHKKKIKNSFQDVGRAEEDNFRNGVLSVLNLNHCDNKTNSINSLQPPSQATSWTEERMAWLENKRQAYHLIGTMKAHRFVNKENTVQSIEPKGKKVSKSAGISAIPENVLGSILSFR